MSKAALAQGQAAVIEAGLLLRNLPKLPYKDMDIIYMYIY